MTESRFPFGEPVRVLQQEDRSPKRVFVLGVYASAVHARWDLPDGRRVRALAVASEPEIFWRGDGVKDIIARINVPDRAGHLSVPDEKFNGPSGRALDEHYLTRLDLSRSDVWLCDLLPESRVNAQQKKAIERCYAPLVREGLVPEATTPAFDARELASDERRQEIADEILESRATTLVTLGELPLKHFAKPLGLGPARLRAFGTSPDVYGRLHDIRIGDQSLKLLPLVHPRQASQLGRSSAAWTSLHKVWAEDVAQKLRLR